MNGVSFLSTVDIASSRCSPPACISHFDPDVSRSSNAGPALMILVAITFSDLVHLHKLQFAAACVLDNFCVMPYADAYHSNCNWRELRRDMVEVTLNNEQPRGRGGGGGQTLHIHQLNSSYRVDPKILAPARIAKWLKLPPQHGATSWCLVRE